MIQSVVNFFSQFASTFWSSTRETAPFLVFGLVLAGILHVLVSVKIISWALGGEGFFSALKGAVLGAPLPLCSCSVLPTALTLRKNGASLSATTSFLISTPETSIDAIAITLAMMPLAFFGLRPLSAIVLSIAVGLIVEKVLRKKSDKFSSNIKKLNEKNSKNKNWEEICRVCGLATSRKVHQHTIVNKIKAIFRYAFQESFEDIGLWIFFGLILGALLQNSIPTDLLKNEFWSKHENLQIFLAILFGIPLYSCATASTPIAAALLMKGLSPGAALVLLLTGPATNIGSLIALRKEFGTKFIFVYLSSMTAVCWMLGYFLNVIYPRLPKHWTTFQSDSNSHLRSYFDHIIPGWVEVLASWLILFLILKIIFKKLRSKHHSHQHEGHEH